MRQRSATNSRHEENGGLRAWYAKGNRLCEFSQWIPHFQGPDGEPSPAQETNHIFSCGGRHDLLTNFIRLSWQNHRWFHSKPADGRVCCLWVKDQKGEIDLAEFKTASGMYLPGWLLKTEVTEEFARAYLEQLREKYP